MDESANSFIVSGWLYGSVVGILLFGYIGDTLGYYKGMIIASCFSFIGFLIRYILYLEFFIIIVRFHYSLHPLSFLFFLVLAVFY